MGKSSIRVDLHKNRIYLKLDGFFTNEEQKTAAKKFVDGLSQLVPNFDVVNDISTFMASTDGSSEAIKSIQIYAKEKGLGNVVRIVDSKLGEFQIKDISTRSGITDVLVATSLIEADKMLDDIRGI